MIFKRCKYTCKTVRIGGDCGEKSFFEFRKDYGVTEISLLEDKTIRIVLNDGSIRMFYDLPFQAEFFKE
jgi:hypothetical protein